MTSTQESCLPFSVQHPSNSTTLGCDPSCAMISNSLSSSSCWPVEAFTVSRTRFMVKEHRIFIITLTLVSLHRHHHGSVSTGRLACFRLPHLAKVALAQYFEKLEISARYLDRVHATTFDELRWLIIGVVGKHVLVQVEVVVVGVFAQLRPSSNVRGNMIDGNVVVVVVAAKFVRIPSIVRTLTMTSWWYLSATTPLPHQPHPPGGGTDRRRDDAHKEDNVHLNRSLYRLTWFRSSGGDRLAGRPLVVFGHHHQVGGRRGGCCCYQ